MAVRSDLFGRLDVQRIRSRIVERASGVFIWAALVMVRMINLLLDVDGYESTRNVLHIISELPSELADMYEVMFKRLTKAEAELALRMFYWLMFYDHGPALSLPTLRHAVAINP
jgi:hypothetical protein